MIEYVVTKKLSISHILLGIVQFPTTKEHDLG